jgi:ATP-binding cassette subfamily A (ABC1) protein 3
VGNP